jgi:hypothetical protein
MTTFKIRWWVCRTTKGDLCVYEVSQGAEWIREAFYCNGEPTREQIAARFHSAIMAAHETVEGDVHTIKVST